MKYAIIKCVNGTFSVASEFNDLDAAKVDFHNKSAALWNAKDVITARISLVDENMIVVDGRFTDWIDRREPEPTPEQEG